MERWMPGSVFDNIDAFANSLGYDNAEIAITLAMVPWDSTYDRDGFIQAITGKDVTGNTGSLLSGSMKARKTSGR